MDVLSRYKQTCLTHWHAPDDLVAGGRELDSVLDDSSFLNKFQNVMASMQAADTLCYLPDDILTKVDRASMAVSLEVRTPLLDHRLFEHAWRLPMHMKVRGGMGKWVLHEILARYLPRELFERPKMGFGVPLDIWLRGPLRPWAEDMLDSDGMKREGILNPGPVRAVWERHLAGENLGYPLWNAPVLQSVLCKKAWLA